MPATLAALTSQCGGSWTLFWPRRFESCVIPLLLRACGILVHSPRFCSLTQSVEQWPEVTRAALTVSFEKRTCGLLCFTLFLPFRIGKHLARDARRGHVPSESVIPGDPVCLSEQWISVGASWGARSCQLSSSHNCRPSTVFSAK